jgi:hypothetical protein
MPRAVSSGSGATADGPSLAMRYGMDERNVSIIPGLHFFCDHRCWRCALAHRCQVPLRMAQDPPRPDRPRLNSPAARVADVVMASLYVTVEQVGIVAEMAARSPAPSERADPAPACLPPPADRRNDADKDPLVVSAKEYASGSLRVLQALRPRLVRNSDEISCDAADRLEETCITVASKIHRAISSALEADADAQDLQGDANGSAKVALLLIDESRRAWRELMRPGRAVGNGAPARYVAMLDRLEAGLHERFPRALEFVRPGFDTLSEAVDGQVARAMLNSQLTTNN